MCFCILYQWLLPASGQSSETLSIDSLQQNKTPASTEIDFLFQYYDQDGNHSAVTGGVGTEKLSDYDSKIRINVVLDSISRLKLHGGVNVYTSASTDRIDPVISSASSEDIQAQLYVDWEEDPSDKNYRYGLGVGGATESDYLSGSLSGFIAWNNPQRGHEFQINTQLFFDRWQLFFPDELRGTSEARVATDRRNAYNLGLSFSQVIRRRWQASLSSDLHFQHGLLSTPFHRVYLAGEQRARLERFPATRWRIPLGLKVHQYWGDFIINRWYYRYYWDSFAIQAHTAQWTLAFKLGKAITLSPSFRYHSQSASRYFAPFQTHSPDADFYTSDFDLSAFQSTQWGIGIRYAPLYGIGRWKYHQQQGLGLFKSAAFRLLWYRRSDGLRAFAFGLHFSFELVK